MTHTPLPSLAHQYVVDNNLLALQRYITQNPSIVHTPHPNTSMYPTTWYKDQNLIHFAARHGDNQTFNYLKQCINLTSSDKTLLSQAAYNTKHPDIIPTVLSITADNLVDEEVVQLAIRANNIQAVSPLLSRCQSYSFNTLLVEAIQHHDNHITHLLLDLHPNTLLHIENVPPHKIHALFLATQCNASILPQIAARYAHEQFTDQHGKNAYHFAIENYDLQALSYLFTRPDIDINQTNKTGQTPLMYALEKKHTKAAIALIQNGADLFKTDRRNQNIVFYAATENNLACMQAIAEQLTPRVNSCFSMWAAPTGKTMTDLVQQASDFGDTPLHAAASKKNPDLIAFLLEYGADPTALNTYGTSPIKVALNHNHIESAQQLTSAKTPTLQR